MFGLAELVMQDVHSFPLTNAGVWETKKKKKKHKVLHRKQQVLHRKAADQILT